MSYFDRLTVHTIVESLEPGHTEARIVSIDPNILIDDYDPSHPNVLWFCDNCDTAHAVTAQFALDDNTPDEPKHLTLCEMCLQNALNGIALSRANPVSFDDPNYWKEEA